MGSIYQFCSNNFSVLRIRPIVRSLSSFKYARNFCSEKEKTNVSPSNIMGGSSWWGKLSLFDETDAKKARKHPVFRITQDGNSEIQEHSLEEIRNEMSLSIRDITPIDRPKIKRGVQYIMDPVISIKRDCLIICLDHLRVIIKYDSCIVFDAKDPTVEYFAQGLSDYLRSYRVRFTKAPFELNILEGILKYVCDQQDRRLNLYQPIIETQLYKLLRHHETRPRDVRRILALKNSLRRFETNSSNLEETMHKVLLSDQMMANMHLTEKNAQGIAKVPQTMHHDVEELLHSYKRHINKVSQQTTYLRRSMDSSQEMLMLNLDGLRNRLINLNLHMAMGTLALASVSAFASIFGMNLYTGMEMDPYAFKILAGSIVFISGSLYAKCLTYAWPKSEEKKRSVNDYRSLTSLLENMHHVEYILNDSKVGLSQQDFSKKYLKLVPHADDSQEVSELVFRIFDVKKDGILDYGEYFEKIDR